VEFAPKAVRYIKLGPGGAWARSAIAHAVLPFGYRDISHEACVAGNGDAVRTELIEAGWKGGGVTRALSEIREFYEQSDECLWITFANGHLWWGFADEEVEYLGKGNGEDPTRQRYIINGWCNTDYDGKPLTLRSLSSALTRTAGYRMTICKVEREDYLLRRICARPDPLIEEAQSIQVQLGNIATQLVTTLDWRDFEILTDLILTRAGWRRLSAVGDGEVDVDLLLEHPTTGETAWVQIKTGSSQSELDDYVARFMADGSCHRFFYICHGGEGLEFKTEEPGMHLWRAEDVAAQAIEAGLLDWLMQRHA
jgi:hypothetical protein